MAPQNDVETPNLTLEKNVYAKADPEEDASKVTRWRRIMDILAKKGDVEFRGCTPVPIAERTETNYFNIFTLWFSMSCNPLP